MMKHKKPPCYIFAGGQNRRMQGKHKAFLEFDGKKAIDILIASLQEYGFESITIVTNNQSLFSGIEGVAVIEDSIPAKGPMGALYTALMDARAESVFCVPCDMPFINTDAISGLIAHSEKEHADCTVVVSSYGVEPLFAVYSTRLRQAVLESIHADRLGLIKFVQSVNTAYLNLSESGIEIYNINTPADYTRVVQNRMLSKNSKTR